ncbi:uncharacterized protein METZ01_LOCUS1929 [marine metagenome]|uniref:Uncharacterized protein n=1 Tax=marine metagenome TaxID=408172 RepID=A0A381N3H5_9ZZZZ
MSKERRGHSTSFEVKMGIKSSETVSQRAARHEVHPDQTQSCISYETNRIYPLGPVVTFGLPSVRR